MRLPGGDPVSADSLQSKGRSGRLPPAEAKAAALAWDIAPDTCLPATEDFPGCADYHGLYPLLHALGLAATPDRHADFYARELGILANAGEFASVLISGTADHGMPEHVARAYDKAGARLDMEILDLCPTPGVICADWAMAGGRAVRTHASDILKWKPAALYDVITTHSFIAKFGPDTRPDLFAAWRQLLRPGGRLVTTARIDPDATNITAEFSAARAEAFAAELANEYEPWIEDMGIDPDELHQVAIRHCAVIKSFAIPSVDELRGLLENGGFEIESLDLVAHQGALKEAQAGAGTNRTAEYADFVAVRTV